MVKFSSLLLVLFCTLNAAPQEKTRLIPFSSANIRYEGRIIYGKDAAVFMWSGTSATLRFEGTTVSAILEDSDTADYYTVIVDGRNMHKIHPGKSVKSYMLADGLADTPHTVTLFKCTEWDKGKARFYGFELPVNASELPAPAPKKRKMEFYGNSITCGYGVEDSSGSDSWFGCFENNYLTYASITARHFNAQYSCIARSGIGIMVSWAPLIMPEMYDRLDPCNPSSKWDFTLYSPDVVVINLFQNDSWLVRRPDYTEFRNRFGTKAPDEKYIISSYRKFVASVREKYPQSEIICTLGSMDASREGSPWPGYIQQAVKKMHDPKIFVHIFRYQNKEGHPGIAEQEAMAESLIGFIEAHIRW